MSDDQLNWPTWPTTEELWARLPDWTADDTARAKLVVERENPPPADETVRRPR